MLDLETAWRSLQEQVLGLPSALADVDALLDWTLDLGSLERFASLPAQARSEVADRLGGAGGPGARLLLRAVAAGRSRRLFSPIFCTISSLRARTSGSALTRCQNEYR